MKQEKRIKQKGYRPGEGFIGRYQRLVKDVVIPYQYKVLCDEVEGAEKSHVRQNFINAGKALRGEENDGFYGMVFQDSDAAKWLEAVAYSLEIFPDKQLEKTADELIQIIVEAQDKDGYLNTYYTIQNREKRWTNLQEGHELYCAGHMMEAACAYFETTGKDVLLKAMLRNMEHIFQHFIVEKAEGYPGHPEIELALLKMYRLTGEKHCFELAEHFINVRGKDPFYYEKEAAKRGWTVWGGDPTDHEYTQSARPVREQSDAVGHAVRAVYLYTAMADAASETEDRELKEACERLWKSITQKRMYVTGGIGSTVLGEAFSVDYDLPGDTAYAETCASIGLIFFASRMLEMDVDRRYSDVIERAFYNTVLAGMQLDGKKFFYVNPLEVIPGISGKAQTQRHDLPVRPKWYTCACCPPNVARLISSLGQYAYGESDGTAYCHLYIDGDIAFQNGIKLHCETKYPYEFTVRYQILSGTGKLALRIPAWSRTYSVTINGENREISEKEEMQEGTCVNQNGYLYLDVRKDDQVTLILDDSPYSIYASTKVPRLTGCKALGRGPLIYCFEGVDNEGDVLSLRLKDDLISDDKSTAFDDKDMIKIGEYEPNLLNGTVRLTVPAERMEGACAEGTKQNECNLTEELYFMEPPKKKKCQAVAVPYYTWGNRGENQMRVWMDKD